MRTNTTVGIAQLSEQTVTDEALMLRVRDHDCREAFTELFNRWNGRIHRLAYRMSGSYQDAEDLVQDVFGNLFRSRERYLAQSRFEAFIWKIALNRARDLSRTKKRKEANQENYLLNQRRQSNSELASHYETIDEVQHALLKLPSEFREVVVLRHFESLRFGEIASLIGIPSGTVASRMARGLKIMKQILDEK